MRSMTGFGRASGASGGREMTAELRSTNSKTLDLSFRLPPRWESFEPTLARVVRAKIARGKVMVAVYAGPDRQGSAPLSSASFRAAARFLRLVSPGPHRPADVVRLALARESQALPADVATSRFCVALVEKALDDLIRSREAEGHLLREEIVGLLAQLEGFTATIEGILPRLTEEVRERLEAALVRLQGTCSSGIVDPERLEREVAMILVKSDIREEVVRVHAHLEACRSCIEGPGPHGKMLDFLVQEIQRELSTLAAKTTNLEVSRLTVRARATVDRIREQVANVE